MAVGNMNLWLRWKLRCCCVRKSRCISMTQYAQWGQHSLTNHSTKTQPAILFSLKFRIHTESLSWNYHRTIERMRLLSFGCKRRPWFVDTNRQITMNLLRRSPLSPPLFSISMEIHSRCEHLCEKWIQRKQIQCSWTMFAKSSIVGVFMLPLCWCVYLFLSLSLIVWTLHAILSMNGDRKCMAHHWRCLATIECSSALISNEKSTIQKWSASDSRARVWVGGSLSECKSGRERERNEKIETEWELRIPLWRSRSWRAKNASALLRMEMAWQRVSSVTFAKSITPHFAAQSTTRARWLFIVAWRNDSTPKHAHHIGKKDQQSAVPFTFH